MRGVGKNRQKIFASLFLSILVLQGIFGCVTSVYAQNGEVSDTTSAAISGAVTTDGVKQGQGIAWGDTSGIVGGILDSLKDFSLWVLNLVKKAIILIIGSPAAALFVWVVNPANVSGPTGVLNFPAVYTLWQFIRDFFNLFFIFILLFSAFATIFQVDSFNIRNIFKNVLLAALLINFSFPITRFLIDVANVPMYYFINDVIGAGGGQGAVTAMNNLLGFSGMSGAALTNGYIDTFAGIIFAFLFSVSLAVLSVMLIVRLVALTLLLIFSPIGFASALVPGLSKYGQEWWSKFWSYALFGPAAALMLVVSLKFLEATQAANVWRSVNEVSTNASVSGEGSTLITNVIFSTIPVILLWATIGLANKFSVAGAATVVGMGYGATHWTRKKIQGAAIGTARFAGRKVEKRLASNKYTRFLSPTAVTTAWKQRAEEQKHKDERPIKEAASAMQDTINRRMSTVIRNPLKWGTGKAIDHTDHNFAEVTRQSGEQRKEMESVSTDGAYIIQELKAALSNKDASKVDAALQILAKNNDLNDMLVTIGSNEKYGLEKDGVTGEVLVSSANALKLIPQLLAESGEKNADILAKKVMNISETATSSGNFAFGGMSKFDESMNNGHGGFRIAGISEQAEWAAAKVKNLESQKRQTTIHPDSLFTRTENGGFGDINGEVAQQIIGTFTQGDVSQANRSRDDMKTAIYNAYTKSQAGEKGYEKFKGAYDSNPIFKEYVHAIRVMKEAKPPKEKTPEEKKAETVAQPGETVTPGGIILNPPSVGSGTRKNT